MIDNAPADAGTRHEDRIPLDPDRPLSLVVHNPDGGVVVRAADRPDVLVGHVKHGAPGRPGYDEAELTIAVSGNRIEVRPVLPSGGASWAGVDIDVDLDFGFGRARKVFKRGGARASANPGKGRGGRGGQVWYDIDIEVPRATAGRVEVHTASGDVRIEDVAGEIGLNTASGDARVSGVRGDIALHTASGDLAVEGATGRLTVRTASGDARITAADLAGFHLQTASGDLHLEAALAGDGPFRAQTASGDVRLTLLRPVAGEAPAATLAFQTVSGDARVDPAFHSAGRRLWRAGSGEGGPRIDVQTVSGDLVVRLAAVAGGEFVTAATPAPSAYEAQPAPPAPPPPPALPVEPFPPAGFSPSAEHDPAPGEAKPEPSRSPGPDAVARLTIVEAVERGEIDVEEALRRLDAEESDAGG